MFRLQLKNFICTVFALVVFLGVCLAVKSERTCVFSGLDGKRTFYLYGASSQALQTEKLSLQELFSVRGESVSFAVGRGKGKAKAEEIIKELGAETLIKEESCETVSYYGYSPALGKCVQVQGKAVNLHIAFSGERLCVGTPIIFGGF